jgi:hypothetical protein
MYVSDPLLEAEREKERRRQETYGESPAWIRRVVQAYTRSEEYKWRALLRQAARGSRADIPLGAPVSVGDAAKQPSAGVPALVSRPTRIATGPVLSTIKPARGQQTTPNQTFVPTQPTSPRTTMDLGNIITQLGSAYITARYGQPRMRTPDYPPSVGGPSRAIMGQPTFVSDDFGVDRLPGVGMQRVSLLPALPGAASTAGKIALNMAAALGITEITEDLLIAAGAAAKTKCRRKRRRLATHSDIKDLAALKAVLGTGKAFDTWIATRKM